MAVATRMGQPSLQRRFERLVAHRAEARHEAEALGAAIVGAGGEAERSRLPGGLCPRVTRDRRGVPWVSLTARHMGERVWVEGQAPMTHL